MLFGFYTRRWWPRPTVYRWWTCFTWHERTPTWKDDGMKIGPVSISHWWDHGRWEWSVCAFNRSLWDTWIRRQRKGA